jgi:uncharacterized protein
MVVVRTVVAALVGAWVFERLKVPAGALIGAMVAVAAVNLVGSTTLPFPNWARFLSFAALGWLLGQGFTRDTLVALRDAAVPILTIVGILLSATVLMTLALRALGVDMATSILASSPGGIAQMGAIAVDMGANASMVVTAHLIRVVSVVVFAPLVARYLVH